MNPAIANSDSYVAFPGMGNLNVGYRGNVSLGDFIYSRGGKTVLFMNDQVTPQEFLKNINDKNKLNAEVKVNVLSVGFKTKNSYQTIGVNLRSNIGVVLPGELLRMAKEGPSNSVYDLSATNVHADAFLEMAYGYSRDIDEQWRVGGKVKLLLGGGNIDGPSAGTAILACIVSAVTGRRIRQDVAVTGEISLAGRVRPVGGVFEKAYGARQAGIKTLVIPKENERDIPEDLLGLDIHAVETAEEAFQLIF